MLVTKVITLTLQNTFWSHLHWLFLRGIDEWKILNDNVSVICRNGTRMSGFHYYQECSQRLIKIVSMAVTAVQLKLFFFFLKCSLCFFLPDSFDTTMNNFCRKSNNTSIYSLSWSKRLTPLLEWFSKTRWNGSRDEKFSKAKTDMTFIFHLWALQGFFFAEELSIPITFN